MKKTTVLQFSLLLCLLTPGISFAEGNEGDGPAGVLKLNFSRLNVDQNQLSNRSRHTGGGLTFTFYPQESGSIGYDLERYTLSNRYSTRLPATIINDYEDRMTVETDILSIGARVHTGTKPLRFYAAAGFAFVENDIKVDPVVPVAPKLKEYDYTSSYYIGGGADLVFGKSSKNRSFVLSWDYRMYRYDSTFYKFDLRNVQLGGYMTSIGLGWEF